MKLFNNILSQLGHTDWCGNSSDSKLSTDMISAIFHGIGQVSSHTYSIDYDNMEKHNLFVVFETQRFFPIDTFAHVPTSELIGNREYVCLIEKDGRTSRLKNLTVSLLIEVDLNNKFNYKVSIDDIIIYRERFTTDYNLLEYKEFSQRSLKRYDFFRLCGERSLHQFREQLINYVKECVYTDFENELEFVDDQKELYRKLNEFNSKIDAEYFKDIFGHVSDLCDNIIVNNNNNFYGGISGKFITPYVGTQTNISIRSNQILSELIEATERTKSLVDCSVIITFENNGFTVSVNPKIEEYFKSGGTASYAYGTASVSYGEYIANDRIRYEI